MKAKYGLAHVDSTRSNLSPPDKWYPGLDLPATGEYHIVSRIAEGSATLLFRAEHRRSHYEAVIKITKASHAKDRATIGEMANEQRVLRHINHPHVIKVYSFHRRAHFPFLVLEFINGTNLKSWNVRRDKEDFETPLAVMAGIAEGLAAVHNASFVHCDIKPQNMLITESGDVRLIDFALARPMRKSMFDLLLYRRRVRGTRSYMSPEQIRGHRLDHRSDIYSFGATLYEVITGKPPFTSNDEELLLREHLLSRPRRIANIILDVNPELDDLVMQALEKDPEKRPESMQCIATVLRELESIKVPRG